MKIIKQGLSKEELEAKLKPIRRFQCRICDCIFEADNNEYRSNEDFWRIIYFCECPNCKNDAFEMRMR